MNKIILSGNLGKAPEMRTTKSGTAVAKFSLATNEYGKDEAGNKVEHTEWHQVVVFGRTAELCGEFLEAGRKVLLEGTVRYSTWDKDDGTKGYKTEILANNVEFLGSGQQG